MEEKCCACGCGEKVTVWKNGRHSPFRRGHHMRKQGYDYYAELKEPKYCKCGCGTLLQPLNNGFVKDYIKGHHLKGTQLDIDYRIERTKKRWGREPTFSPYLDNVFVTYSEKMGRWSACLRTTEGKSRSVMHSYAVYLHYFGEIPKGYAVHHKDGQHSNLSDDRPENLMLLPDKWNLRFFPTLAEGFGIPELDVTNAYISLNTEGKCEKELFAELCSALARQIKEQHE